MVPLFEGMVIDGWRFPRASGDGPTQDGPIWYSSRFPPRERGWSLARVLQAHVYWVSPARAGMVPRHM